MAASYLSKENIVTTNKEKCDSLIASMEKINLLLRGKEIFHGLDAANRTWDRVKIELHKAQQFSTKFTTSRNGYSGQIGLTSS